MKLKLGRAVVAGTASLAVGLTMTPSAFALSDLTRYFPGVVAFEPDLTFKIAEVYAGSDYATAKKNL